MAIKKGNLKRVTKPRFWGERESQISEELKEMIFEQYLSYDSLACYCDCSVSRDLSQMACACTYVGNGSIIVKQQYAYPPKDCVDKPIYGELKALIFALTNFEKYMMPGCEKVTFYSDVDDIEGFLHNKITFKRNASLKKLQSELILLYQRIQKMHPNIRIDVRYLQPFEKVNNPFHRSSHNAVKRMLNNRAK